MKINIAPYTVTPSCDCPSEAVGFDKDLHIRNVHSPITYWGVFLDDVKISATSSRDLAEKTREWMKHWLAGVH